MLCLNECKAKLVSFKQCFGHEFGIKSIGIFGSVARQENREDSDLDIVVDIDNPPLYINGFFFNILFQKWRQ